MDLQDRASEQEELDRERALKEQAARANFSGDWEAESAKWCQDTGCGQRIPDERRRAIPGVKFCVECQERHEREERRRE